MIIREDWTDDQTLRARHHVDHHNELAAAANAGGGGGLTPATPFTVTQMPNTITGDGDIDVMVFPAETAAIAIALDGDEFPRWLLSADPSGAGIAFGPGTVDPYDGGAYIATNSDSHVFIGSNASDANVEVGRVTVKGDTGDLMLASGAGLVLWSPDSTPYRVKVADNGTLSTEEVV